MAKKNSAACLGEASAAPAARRRHVLWIPKERATYSGPLSPERKAECDRELDEMRHQVFEQMDRRIDESIDRRLAQRIDRRLAQRIDRRIEKSIDRRIDRRIEKSIDEYIFSVMD